jgi:hypothetical protein
LLHRWPNCAPGWGLWVSSEILSRFLFIGCIEKSLDIPLASRYMHAWSGCKVSPVLWRRNRDIWRKIFWFTKSFFAKCASQSSK